MLKDTDTPIRSACRRRYSAWTLYARAFTGNRADADDVVRKAVNRTFQASDDLRSERQAHERVLGAIRSEALELLERRKSAAGLDGPPPEHPNVLQLLIDQHSKTDPRHAGEVAVQMLQELPRPQRRAIERLLLRRPAMPLPDVARKGRLELDTATEEIEEGLDMLAAALHAVPENIYVGGHPDLKSLTAYVDGALSGDEARAVVAHCGECSECGDRLGMMVLLRSGAAKAALKPRVSRGVKAAALVVTVCAGLVGGAMLASALAPNPWADHATAEGVPRWFHDFLYGSREEVNGRDAELAAGLELLVRGDYQAAIDRLTPLVETPASRPEASAYLGIAQYLGGNVSRTTVELLETGTMSSRAGRISDWYLANTLLARGDVERARRRLQGLAMVGDWVGRQADGLLDALLQAEQRGDPVVVG
jgi:DNA-directed RNA polymerase specialized sigma24 family protein